MFKHILVPLDGSKLAEASLPVAIYLAQKLHSQVTLLHLIEENAPSDIHGEKHLREAGEAQLYLKELSGHFDKKTVVKFHVHQEKIENVALSIVTHSREELAPDLIVMCAHGKGGLRDAFLGNIAQQVLTASKIPVLLIDVPKKTRTSAFELKTILIPLDGETEHERALPTGQELAQKCHSSIILLTVVPTLSSLKGERAATGLFLPGAMNASLDQVEEEAEVYLQKRLNKLTEAGLTGSLIITRGDPADGIATTAKSSNSDLVIMGTHAKVGSQAFWSSSVASKVSKLSCKPILFIPV